MKQRPTYKQLLLGFLCVDIVLLLAAVFLFGYIFSHRSSSKKIPETVSPSPELLASPLPTSPSPHFTPTPAPTVTPRPLQTATFTAFHFSYDAAQMAVLDRSREVGTEAVAITGSNDVPRVDIQALEPLPGLTQAQFEILARSAVTTYFAHAPEALTLEDSVTGQAEYSAQLTLPETADSPALLANIRLLLGEEQSILAICLLPADADAKATAAFQDVLTSVTSD